MAVGSGHAFDSVRTDKIGQPECARFAELADHIDVSVRAAAIQLAPRNETTTSPEQESLREEAFKSLAPRLIISARPDIVAAEG